MCQPKSKGGRRCAAHTRPQYQRVMQALRTGNEQQAAATIGAGFEAVRDYAMTLSGRDDVVDDINALEAHWHANPSASVEQEIARQTTLGTLRAAVNVGDRRAEAVTQVNAAVKAMEHAPAPVAVDVPAAIIEVEETIEARQRAAAEQAAARAEQDNGWALTADTLTLPSHQQVGYLDGWKGTPAYQALQYRLANTTPGDTFNIDVEGEQMTLTYDERFDTVTGKTTYVLTADTATSHSETTFISRDHLTGNVHDSVFAKGAWADRRTATNPRLAQVIADDYDRGLIEAGKPYTRTFDELQAEYASLCEEYRTTRYPISVEDKLEALDKEFGGRFSTVAKRAWGEAYDRGLPDSQRPSPRWPTPQALQREQAAFERDLARKGVQTYLSLAAEDEKALEAARVEHRAAVDEWEANQKEREGSVLRRMLPTSPRPAIREVERKTTPHPFGGMTKDEWVKYEAENLTKFGQTDLSEFTTHRGTAQPTERPQPGWSGSILDEPREPSVMDNINTLTDIVRKYQRPDTQTA